MGIADLKNNRIKLVDRVDDSGSNFRQKLQITAIEHDGSIRFATTLKNKKVGLYRVSF